MENLILRIDDRLIHGQVLVGWVQRLCLKHIIVANDEMATDKLRINLFRVAIPDGVESIFMTITDTIKFILNRQTELLDTIILVKNPQDTLQIIRNVGNFFKSINVGGMHYQKGKRQLMAQLSINKADVDALYEIHKLGIELESRILPFDDKIDVIKFLEKNGILKREEKF